MKKRTLYTTFVVVVILALTLTACNLFGETGGGEETPDPAQVATIAAATVSAKFTQIAADAMAAQLTQMAMVTNTPVATSTPLPTETLSNTPTAVPPTKTPVPPTPTKIPIPCYAARFIEDVTVVDGTSFYTGDPFVKTWKVKNVGSCSWTKDYKIFFFGGNQLGAANAIAFPVTVNPGESVNLSVQMTAPTETGTFSGSWMLKAANGTVFGVGDNYNVALSVKIKVLAIPKPKDENTVYDMVKKYCAAKWRTNAGGINCPSAAIDTKNGSITRTFAPVIEGGYKDDEGALITVPAIGGDGMIRGKFPKMLINSGDHFKASLTCQNGKKKCSVTYELQYSEAGSDTILTLGTWDKNYGDPMIHADVDLSSLAGKEVNLYLKVISNSDSTDDVAMWVAARITHP